MTRPGPITARALALQLSALRELRHWDEAAMLAERVSDALAGTEGLSPADLQRASRWARRWSDLHPDTRAFYVRALNHTIASSDQAAVHVGLRSILDDRPAEPWARGILSQLHRQLLGVAPERDLTDPPRRTRP